MSSFPSLENRSLKRKKHCPPDVYQQRDEQKEDLMSEDFVRDGYRYTKPVRDEYESCKEESKFVNLDSLWRFFHGVVVHKYECSNFQDLRRKPTTSVRDTMLPAIIMYKGQVSDWFKELAGAALLQSLRKRMPYYKDKEEIVNELLANEVPISRAIWFINMSVIQTTALAENAKEKQRAPFDPTGEWTHTICRMLTRMLEHSCSEPQNSGLEADWEYLFTLLLAMYDKDMADHWEVLLWTVKRAEFLSSQSESKSPASPSAPPGLLDADQTTAVPRQTDDCPGDNSRIPWNWESSLQLICEVCKGVIPYVKKMIDLGLSKATVLKVLDLMCDFMENKAAECRTMGKIFINMAWDAIKTQAPEELCKTIEVC
ncbi:unnamed protein product [Calicophoron daubneyi]|uniref:Saposin B-type domain-containing protein n=1 Tax=Calicophoron daubneyi TaxID=300641 RepID=A0AAV2TT49_CALDB